MLSRLRVFVTSLPATRDEWEAFLMWSHQGTTLKQWVTAVFGINWQFIVCIIKQRVLFSSWFWQIFDTFGRHFTVLWTSFGGIFFLEEKIPPKMHGINTVTTAADCRGARLAGSPVPLRNVETLPTRQGPMYELCFVRRTVPMCGAGRQASSNYWQFGTAH